MIALLTGRLAHKSPEFIIMDVNGVGYRVQIPFSTYYDLPEEGKSISLNIYTQVKEDAINLYGFRSLTEKNFFQLLISVAGIGPKLGKDILSNIQVEELARALTQGDLARLSSIPGIGRKTAERLVLELKSKVLKLEISLPARDGSSAAASSAITDDVTSALVNLGYKEAQVKKALAELEIAADTSMEELLKRALKLLMK
ncbi:MAG: Holliday junction branch migration protein RuvA [Geobacteraceae bacterium]|nr:Holliday junction branch migration protein RuvA [Geobacteraceae bacterium]